MVCQDVYLAAVEIPCSLALRTVPGNPRQGHPSWLRETVDMNEQERMQALKDVVGPRGAWMLRQRACMIETPRKSAARGRREQGLDGWQQQRLLKNEKVRIPLI